MVPHNTDITPSTEKNVIKVVTKHYKDKQLYKRENIKETDVIEGGRSARAGRGVNTYDKHFDQNLKMNRHRRKRPADDSDSGPAGGTRRTKNILSHHSHDWTD
jgi:hypothetical protein